MSVTDHLLPDRNARGGGNVKAIYEKVTTRGFRECLDVLHALSVLIKFNIDGIINVIYQMFT